MFISTFLCIDFLIYLYIYMHASQHFPPFVRFHIPAPPFVHFRSLNAFYTTLPSAAHRAHCAPCSPHWGIGCTDRAKASCLLPPAPYSLSPFSVHFHCKYF
uniref:Putative secreted protein n=1 Tax=Anopheles triannulatus TaxID=58253 RepID=A0A2M4B5A8_9DIPT